MKIKNTVALALGLTMVAATAGCSSDQGGDVNSDGTLSGTLVISAYATAKPALDPLIEQFEADHPDLTVNATYADNQPYQAAIRTQLSSGTGPDLFTVWPGNGNPGAVEVLAPTGYLLDLSTVDGLPELPDSLASVTQVEGTQYVYPLTVAGIGGVYNEQAVEEAGAKIPETWDEVLAFCEAATTAGKVGFSLGLQSLFVTQLINYSLSSTLVYSENPDFEQAVAGGSATFADSGWKQSFEQYMDMEEAGCFTPSPLGTTNDVAQADVANGSALASVTLTTTISQIKSLAPEGVTFGMFALPATGNPDDTWMPAAAFDGFGINADANNLPAAEEFLRFITTPEAMGSYAQVAGSLPSVDTDSFELDSTLTVLNDLWLEERTYPFPDQLWPNPMVATVHKEGVQKVFGEQATIDDILLEMDSSYSVG